MQLVGLSREAGGRSSLRSQVFSVEIPIRLSVCNRLLMGGGSKFPPDKYEELVGVEDFSMGGD